METTTRDALVEALYQTEGKAEIINGEVVHLMATGCLPSRAATRIVMRLHDYERRTGRGYALGDNTGFLVDLPHRQSFSPDAAFYTGEPTGMKFLKGAPVSAAGTRAIWGVDLQGEDVVRLFCDGNAEAPAAAYRRGDTAKAEPAFPGFSMPVDDLFA